MNTKNKKILIFDLDDTLFDSSGRDRTQGDFKMKVFDGVLNLLETVPAEKVLVTKGELEYQNKKINVLGIRNQFAAIHICPTDEDKLTVFTMLTKKYPGRELIIIGNRIDSEIRYGKMLGHRTIHLHFGKYAGLVAKDQYEVPDYTVQSFSAIKNILNK